MVISGIAPAEYNMLAVYQYMNRVHNSEGTMRFLASLNHSSAARHTTNLKMGSQRRCRKASPFVSHRARSLKCSCVFNRASVDYSL